MTEPTESQSLPGFDVAEASSSAKKKPAAKKVAKKAAKKVAVKKVAKKAVKKVAKKAPAAAEAKPAAAEAKLAATEAKLAAVEAKLAAAEASPREPRPAQEDRPVRERNEERNEHASDSGEPKRFGRVPGGGPLVPRGEEAPPEGRSQEGRRQEGRDDDNRGRNDDNRGRNDDNRARNDDNRGRDGRNQHGRNQEGSGSRDADGDQGNRNNKRRRNRRRRNNRGREDGDAPEGEPQERPTPRLDGPKVECNGMLELAPKGFGFLRVPSKNFEQARDDVFVPPETIRKFNLRLGQWIHGFYQEGSRGPQLVEIATINGMTVEQATKLPHFDELKAINPTKRISFETTPDRYTTRVVDIMAPVGKGQRGLIVSPPRSGKTTMMLHMAEAIREKYEESMHLMVLLVDERPEEVTEFRRALPDAEIYASSNDEQARNHCRIAELAIERAKRLVEAGQDVFLLMDSITRLARAYNNNMSGGDGMRGHKGNRNRGIGSGGITIGALEVPRRLFAAARNTRGGGSLTIMATALIQTNSRADDAIFMEFKGTGNMELVLDRKIAENYIYPAVDIFKSGTRREELLLPDHMLHKIHLIRRGLSGHRPVEAMERLLFFLKKFSNNPQMLLEIKG